MNLEKLDLKSHALTDERKEELLRLFPEIRTEGGKIDLERLKLVLGETVDIGKERYGMNWPGKADCFKTIQSPSMGTLRPCPEESVNFETTDNMIIEGDNLEVLKLLQKSFIGKIKLICTDPPYNTGNDFIYPDNYTESLQTYLEYTGQVDSQGKKFGTNTEADGRFHSKWLNMMYPRLYLLRNLLKDDGVILLNIDDNEVDNLKKMCSEIFGEENFLAQLIWNLRSGSQAGHFTGSHQYLLCYAREKASLSYFEDKSGGEIKHGALKKISSANPASEINFPKGIDFEGDEAEFRGELGNSERQYISGKMIFRNGKLAEPVTIKAGWAMKNQILSWLEGKETFDSKGQRVSRFYFNRQGILWYEKERGTIHPKTVLPDEVGNTKTGSDELESLLNERILDFPKPSSLIRFFIELITRPKDIVLDIFAGSGTAAHAVLDQNRKDGGNRKFILVQLPEPTGREDYPTIADICKERVRRVINNLNKEDEGKLPFGGDKKPDRGFRVFKLDESSFKTWNANIPKGDVDALNRQLELHIDHIREGRTTEDILYEILLKSGFPLTTPVEKLTIEGKSVFSAVGGAFFICLERKLTLELIRAMAKKKPERVVFLDEGFAGNDQLKANAVQIFKTNGITSFKTV